MRSKKKTIYRLKCYWNFLRNQQNTLHNHQNNNLMKINSLFMDCINRQLSGIVTHRNLPCWILWGKANGRLGMITRECQSFKLWKAIFQKQFRLTLKFKPKCNLFWRMENKAQTTKINKNKSQNQHCQVGSEWKWSNKKITAKHTVILTLGWLRRTFQSRKLIDKLYLRSTTIQNVTHYTSRLTSKEWIW